MPSTDELLAEVREQTGQDPARERSETSSHSPRERERDPATEGRSLGARFREQVFSPRGFVLSLVFLTLGYALVAALSPFGPVDQFVGLFGMFAAAFALGLLGKGRYREVAVAGGVAAGVTAFFNFLTLSFVAGLGVPLVGAGAGVLAAVVGLYFGRDLRAGLTTDL